VDYWLPMATMLAALAPLVGVPLGVITLYLRSIRDQQSARHGELVQRMGTMERSLREVGRAVSVLERNYTTKEEWLRESMHARRQLERLTEMVARLEAGIEHSSDLAARFAREVDPQWAGAGEEAEP